VRPRYNRPVPQSLSTRLPQIADDLLRAAELHGVPPAACVAIEDSHWGLESARTAGMRTLAITHTYPRDALTGSADVVIDSLAEVTLELVARL